MLALPIPYATAFQITIAINFLIFLFVLFKARRSMGTEMYGFWRGIAIFLGILVFGLIISYIAQATFMGWM